MRVSSIISALAAAVTVVAGAALPDCGSEIGCDLLKRHSPANDARDLTNGERLRRGLPLKSPILRRGAFVWGWYISPSLLKDFRLF